MTAMPTTRRAGCGQGRRGRWITGLIVLWLGGGAAQLAMADIPQAVRAKFAGRILISDRPLPEEVGDANQAIAAYDKLNRAEIQGLDSVGIRSWTFFYTAFLRKPSAAGSMSLDFHTADREQRYVADKRLRVEGKLAVVAGQVTITEDDGPARGRKYHLILRAKHGKRDRELARTTVVLK